MKIEISGGRITVKPNTIFLWIGIGAWLLSCTGIRMLILCIPPEEPGDIVGIVFLCVWTLVVFSLGIAAVRLGVRTITIDKEGVSSRTLGSRKSLTWGEIEDYGLSYSGQTRGEGNTYTLYFAVKKQRTRNDCKKRLKGKMIKTYIIGCTYSEVTEKVFPLCKSFTHVEPFIAADKFHFI